jgi:hypothetical protein
LRKSAWKTRESSRHPGTLNNNKILEVALGNLIVALTEETNRLRNKRPVNTPISDILCDILVAPRVAVKPIED